MGIRKYFHFKASQRRRKNTILSIQDNRGKVWKDKENMQHTFLNYFQNIFSSSTPNIQEIMFVIKDRVTPNMAHALDSQFSASEVVQAMKQLKSCAAPGPDGLTAMFYHKYWDIIGPEITSFVLKALNDGEDVSAIKYKPDFYKSHS